MSSSEQAVATRPLNEALRHITLPRHLSRQDKMGSEFAWQDDDVHIRFRVRATLPSGPWLHALIHDQALCIHVAPNDERRIGERAWSDYEGDARLMAWTLLHDSLLDALSRMLDGAITPMTIVGSPAQVSSELVGPVLEFEILDEDSIAQWTGNLALNDEHCGAVLERATSAPVTGVAHTWSAVPVPLALRCDGPTIDAEALQTCAAGDMIVLTDKSRLLERMQAYHPDGRPLPVLCQVDTEGVRLALNLNDKENLTMSQTPTAPTNDTSLASHIPVRLAIQTAAVDVSLADLEALESGVVLPLEVPVAGTNVTILANGAPIGDGELVAAGDKLAVCIRRWKPDGL